MASFFNPGTELFEDALRSEIYVDKSDLLRFTNSVLRTNDRFVAVSRPRRFGKTMTLDMMSAYYGRTCNSEAMFAPLKIANAESFKEHLNKYNILFVNIRDVVSHGRNWDEMIGYYLKRLVFEIKKELPDIQLFDETNLVYILEDVYMETSVPFVFLIDEWDALFRVDASKNNKAEQTKYLDFLRMLLKDKSYVALAYMTGILPIKKYGEHSALNMFAEYSMTEAVPISEFTGFTVGEVKALCEEFDVSYDEMRSWYDGYLVDGYEIYNPRSVVQACMKKVFGNYWTKTETYEALKVYIEMDIDGLRDTIVRLMAGERIPIDTHSFTNDMVTFSTKDDVLSLLIHLGYLTYDFDTGDVWIPNREILDEYATSIRVINWSGVADAIRDSNALLTATLAKDAQLVAEMLEQIHQSETSIMAYNNENALSAVITIAYYVARREYDLARELPSGKGFADISFLPKKGSNQPAMVVELKVDKDADAAIDQIHRKEYVEGLAGYTGKVLLVGIAYDRQTKKHSCLIEEIEKE